MHKYSFLIVAIAFFSACSVSRVQDQWKLVWSDEFNYDGLPNNQKWNYDTVGNPSGWGNGESQWHTYANLKNASVNNGSLKITAIKEPTQGKKYSSARLTTKNKGDWKYGKVRGTCQASHRQWYLACYLDVTYCLCLRWLAQQWGDRHYGTCGLPPRYGTFHLAF